MKRFVVAVLIVFGLAQPAFAGGDVCVVHSSDGVSVLLILTKPKLPKERSAVPIVGLLDLKAMIPVSGSIARRTTDSFAAGLTFYQQTGANCVEWVDIDETFEGSGVISCDGVEDGVTWDRVGCDDPF